jgi:hypothetical protein
MMYVDIKMVLGGEIGGEETGSDKGRYKGEYLHDNFFRSDKI